MKALAEIGWRKALRFGWFTLAMVPYRMALVPQLRAPWLRLLGAAIGRRVILNGDNQANVIHGGSGDDENGSIMQHVGEDLPGCCAECDANSHFAHPLRDRVRKDAVEAKRA